MKKYKFPEFLLASSKEKINSLAYLPRWIIFCIDICILILANMIAYLLMLQLPVTFYPTYDVYERFGMIIGVNVFFFILFKTYTGIIRHSSFVDAVRLLLSTAASLLVLMFLNYYLLATKDQPIFLFSGLILSFIFSFLFLFIFRIAVKYFFEFFISHSPKKNTIKAVVLGFDDKAVAMVHALKMEVPSRFKIVGFLGNSKSHKSKSILGLPILYNEQKSISVLLRKLKAKALIIADKSLSKEEKINIVDDCLANNIQVFTIPLVMDWEKDKNISKKIKSFQIEDLLERKPIVLDNVNISSQLTGTTIMVTGAAGSIGSEIVWQVLRYKPKRLLLVDQAETPLHHLTLEVEKNSNGIAIFSKIADIRNPQNMQKIFEEHRPDIVFHAAAYKHVPLMENNPCQAVQTNIMGTKNLADLSVAFGVEKFVMVSTDKAVNPSNVMGASKRIAEKYVQALHAKQETAGLPVTKFITTRFGNVLGSNGSVVPLFKKQIESGGPITITHPDIIRYFMTIPEACQLVLEAAAMGKGGEIFLFDMGKPVKIINLAHKMIQLAGFEPEKDIAIKFVGLRPGEKLYEELLTDGAKSIPTHHEKIMIAAEEMENPSAVIAAVEALITLSVETCDELVVQQMKKIVPEYISLNSDYASFDL